MLEKRILDPQRVRKITGSFAFVEHRFLSTAPHKQGAKISCSDSPGFRSIGHDFSNGFGRPFKRMCVVVPF